MHLLAYAELRHVFQGIFDDWQEFEFPNGHLVESDRWHDCFGRWRDELEEETAFGFLCWGPADVSIIPMETNRSTRNQKYLLPGLSPPQLPYWRTATAYIFSAASTVWSWRASETDSWVWLSAVRTSTCQSSVDKEKPLLITHNALASKRMISRYDKCYVSVYPVSDVDDDGVR